MEKLAPANSTRVIHRCLPWLFFLLIFSFGTLFAAPPDELQPPHRPDRLILKPKAGAIVQRAAALNAAHAVIGAHIHRQYPMLRGIEVVQLPKGHDLKQAIEHYRKTGLFEYVVPDYEVSVAATPNDPSYLDGTLWGMNNTGQNGGTADADIDAPEAWDVRTNADTVIVAVIDTGVRYTHEDLASNMWVNTGEIPGNGIDDDGDGYIDDVYGINAITGSGDPMDDHGHGTHCSGTIGAVGDNGKGVVGVAWRVQIMALKFLSAAGSGSDSDAIECINYAVAHGANIMSNSWGCQGCFDQALLDAIAAARDAGIIFVAAAGNNGTDIDATPFYPAGYDVNNLVSVAATDRNDQRASFSNYGATGVDLGAPGVSIYSTYNSSDSGYATLSGTSMACPHVAGALAVMKAQFPSESYTQLIWRVLGNVDPLASLSNLCVTGGRLNLYKALTREPPPLANFTAAPVGDLSYSFTDTSLGPVTNRVWDFGDNSPFSNDTNPTHLYPSNGLYNVMLTVFGSGGSSSKTKPIVLVTNYYMQATTFSWVDPTNLNSLHMGDDDVSSAQLLPFVFTYYGQAFSNLYIAANGMLGFGPAGMNQYINSDIPSSATPNTTMYAFWDDLNPGAGGDVRFGIIGTAPHRVAVATWLAVPHYAYPINATFSFQALLYEGGNEIVFQYLEVRPNDLNYGAGRNATIGVENQDGSLARKYSFNGSLLLSNNQAIAFTVSGVPPPPPPPPQPQPPLAPVFYSAFAVATNSIDLFWSSITNATGYVVRRDGVAVGSTSLTSYSDIGVLADTKYCYTIAATNDWGSSSQTGQKCATTPLFAMDGEADFPGYLQVGSNMTLYAAVHGRTLYVATLSPGTNGPNDHFILVSDELLPSATANAPWAKAGLVAVQLIKPFLAGESQNDTRPEDEWVGWYIDDNAPDPFQLAAKAPTETGVMEGTLNLITVFGYLPPTIYIAAAAYETDDGGALVAQTPDGNGDDNIDPNEFLALPTVAILDRNHDGLYDRLDPKLDFTVSGNYPNPTGGHDLVWACVPGRKYQLQYCDSLTADTWHDLGTERTADAGQIFMSYTDPTANGTPQRFYRVKLVP
jgi:subtilisin family serine protease